MSLLKTIAENHLAVKFERKLSNFERVVPKEQNEVRNEYKNNNMKVKVQLFKSNRFAKITNTCNNAYMRVCFNTKPWLVEGLRLLGAEHYEDFIKMVGKYKTELDSDVSDFLNNWDEEMTKAYQDAGLLAGTIKWPTKEEFKASFALEYVLIPLADTFKENIVVPIEEYQRLNDWVKGWEKEQVNCLNQAIQDVLYGLEQKVQANKIRADSLEPLVKIIDRPPSGIEAVDTFHQSCVTLTAPIIGYFNHKTLKKYAVDRTKFQETLRTAQLELDKQFGEITQ